MTTANSFDEQLARLSTEAVQHPDRFGPGVRLLFSCGARDMVASLAAAEAQGIDARGVGRMHILVEFDDVVPDTRWAESTGAAVGRYFEAIGGKRPQIGIDRAAG
ncbi:MAG TPA: hypothetical protein VHO04_15065 [Sphingopyxis sp.]|uniref:hypothetical protein n=1 Tax=Sphingopyxis sp. TaxID=1908224 RepID=UPI002E2F417F|nr:hypothetical protein [Sphingopyxis sp.]HEX2813995.1 hypothetical protein [Sphingopyxis sp.]